MGRHTRIGISLSALQVVHRLVQSLQPLDSKNLSEALIVTSDCPAELLLAMMSSKPSLPLSRAQ